MADPVSTPVCIAWTTRQKFLESLTSQDVDAATASQLLIVIRVQDIFLLVLVTRLDRVVQGEDVVFRLICILPLKVFQQRGAGFRCCRVPHTLLPGGESSPMVRGRWG